MKGFYLIFGAVLFVSLLVAPSAKAMTVDELNAQIAQLQAQITALQIQLGQLQSQSSVWCHDFNVNLKRDNENDDIFNLQKALEKEGLLTTLDIDERGYYFGKYTTSAVFMFQEKYKSEILTPLGLKYPTGFVGKATREKLNKLYGCIKPICIQVLTPAKNPVDNQCKVFPTPCDVPAGWIKVSSCPITTPSIAVLSPNGGEKLVQGKTYQISWKSSADIDKVDVYLDTREMGGSIAIARNIINIGQYDWTIPVTIYTGEFYEIRIQTISIRNPVVSDRSDNTFNIVSQLPTVEIKANNLNDPVTIDYNSPVILSWISVNTESCVASNGWSGIKTVSGSETVGNLIIPKTYTISCSGPNGTSTKSITVSVSSYIPSEHPMVDIKVNNTNGPVTIPYNDYATLTWTTSDVKYCTASGGWSGSRSINNSESTGGIIRSTIYTLTCSGDGGTVTDSVTVNVLQPTISKKVSLLIYNPVLESKDGKKLSDYLNWNDPDNLASQYRQNILETSHNSLQYEIVERKEVDGFPKKLDGFTYTDESYLACVNDNSKCHSPDNVNYNWIIETEKLCDKLNSGAIDEVWLFGAPWFGYWESTLAGPNGFWYNSSPVMGTACQKLLPIMGFSYHVGVDMMLEDLGHRAESTMWKVYGSWDNTKNDTSWNIYTHIEKDTPGQAQCGNVHYAPNSIGDYDRSNTSYVSSACGDWYNYPNLTGTRKTMNCSEWNCTTLGYLQWWFNHMPYVSGSTNGVLNNWWHYISDPNECLTRI